MGAQRLGDYVGDEGWVGTVYSVRSKFEHLSENRTADLMPYEGLNGRHGLVAAALGLGQEGGAFVIPGEDRRGPRERPRRRGPLRHRSQGGTLDTVTGSTDDPAYGQIQAGINVADTLANGDLGTLQGLGTSPSPSPPSPTPSAPSR